MAQNCQVWAVLYSKGVWESFSMLEIVYWLAIDLYSYMKKVRGLLRNKFLSYRVMARLLDFEEK